VPQDPRRRRELKEAARETPNQNDDRPGAARVSLTRLTPACPAKAPEPRDDVTERLRAPSLAGRREPGPGDLRPRSL